MDSESVVSSSGWVAKSSQPIWYVTERNAFVKIHKFVKITEYKT